MLTLTGKVVKVFAVPAATNTATGEVRPPSSKVQIMGEVPVKGGDSRLEIYDLKTDRGSAFQAALNKTVRCPVGVYNVEGNSGLYLLKDAEIQLVDEKGHDAGPLVKKVA